MNLNLPNKLTLTRIILVPIVFILMLELPWQWASGYNAFINSVTGRVLVLILFVIAALTDFFDGRIARKYNLITNFGKFMDPLADKLLVLAVFLAFVPTGRLHAFLFFIILARELIITGLRQIAMEQGVVIAASVWGKWKTTFQMLAIIALMIEGIVKQKYLATEPSIRAASELGRLHNRRQYFARHRDRPDPGFGHRLRRQKQATSARLERRCNLDFSSPFP